MKAYLLIYKSVDGFTFDINQFVLLSKNKKQLEDVSSFLNTKIDEHSDFSIKEVTILDNQLKFYHIDDSDESYTYTYDQLPKDKKIEENFSTLTLIQSLKREHYSYLYSFVFSPFKIKNYKEINSIVKQINISKLNGEYYTANNKYKELEYSI